MLTCAHPAWKSTSAPLFFCTSGKETVENLKISHGQLVPCQENRIKGQQTVSSAGCKVLASNAGFLLASMPSYCRFRPIEYCYSQSVSVSVPQDKIQGSAIYVRRSDVWTAFWSLVVRAGKVRCRFWGTFCAFVNAMLSRWACEACSTRGSCKYVHDEPDGQSEVEIVHCRSTVGRDLK